MAERTPAPHDPAKDAAPSTIQLINVLVAREGETVSSKWGIHPQLKRDLTPQEWQEVTDHMNRVTRNLPNSCRTTPAVGGRKGRHDGGVRQWIGDRVLPQCPVPAATSHPCWGNAAGDLSDLPDQLHASSGTTGEAPLR